MTLFRPSTRTPVSSELMAGLARTASRMASTSGSARAASRVQGRGDRPFADPQAEHAAADADQPLVREALPVVQVPAAAPRRAARTSATPPAPAGASPTVRLPQLLQRAAYTHASITTGRSSGRASSAAAWPNSACTRPLAPSPARTAERSGRPRLPVQRQQPIVIHQARESTLMSTRTGEELRADSAGVQP